MIIILIVVALASISFGIGSFIIAEKNKKKEIEAIKKKADTDKANLERLNKYIQEKKENEEVIDSVTPDNLINKLQDLSERGKQRRN